MSTFGKCKLEISNGLKTIKESQEKINDYNVSKIELKIITDDGNVHKITVHDYNIIWENDIA